MVNTTALKEAFKKRGIKQKFLAEEMGITPTCLSRKIKNKSEFKGCEIFTICTILELSKEEKETIFFK